MPVSTQFFLEVEQIREGVLILKDHTLRGVMMVSSLNFALKSREEQEAIIYQFQNFLNSLDFSCQFLVQSRKLNITGYLDRLKELEEKQENKLLKAQTREYRQFIEKLVAGSSIMTKHFYIIVPFYLSESPGAVAAGGVLFKLKTAPVLTEELFQKCKSQLYQRMEFLALGLRRCGVWSIPLNSEELAELLWALYHPAEARVGYYPEIPPELIK
ncbi:hypothetical protein J7J24_01185 [bacterium]|nr:hypothetical protein [bacterium]